jgi:DNA-binding beta-propeller fold protein YncE
MGHRRHHGPLLLALALLALLLPASPAAADLVIGSTGSGAGQYDRPRGVAVDTATGRLYVADRLNNRIDVFDQTGAFLFAFGWRVNATTPEDKLQICTTASGCLPAPPGSKTGQFGDSGPLSIAADSSSHAVYVSDLDHRVQKFDSEGNFLWMVGGEVDKANGDDLCTVAADCGPGKAAEKAPGEEEGRFFEPLFRGLPIAIGPGGVLHVADSRKFGSSEGDGFNTRIQKFEPSGAYLGPQIALSRVSGRVQALAVDLVGDIYVADEDSPSSNPSAVSKYDSAGNPVASWGESGKVANGGNIGGVTLDSAGGLFVTDFSSGINIFSHYDPTGAKSSVFFGDGSLAARVIALAFHQTASGDIFVAESLNGPGTARVVQIALPDPGPLLVPGSTKADPVGNVKATLNVAFNPEGKASTAHFEYITKAAYEAAGNEFGAGTQVTPESAPSPADFETATAGATNVCIVPTEPSCLEPQTTYYFRAVVANADGTVKSEKAEFTTLPPASIPALWASDVGTDSARLHAEVNPFGLVTTGRFEWVDEVSFQSEGGFASPSTRTSAAIDFGSGEAAIHRATQAYPLEAGTTYRYRAIASNPFFAPVVSATQAFTTFAATGGGAGVCAANAAFRTGPSAALPDCRAYELVSPLDKSNGDILTRPNVTGYPTHLHQSSGAGSDFTYSSYRAFATPQSAPYTNQIFATRHERGQASEGWQNEAIAPPRGPQFRLELENEYKAFSEDLSKGWLLQEGEPTLDPCAPAGFAGLYRRESADGSFEALSCVHPSQLFEELVPPPTPPAREFMPELEGFSADGSHAVLRIDDALTKDASSAIFDNGTYARPVYQVYLSSGAGELHLVSALPSGKASDLDSSAGTGTDNELFNHHRFQSVAGAVSADGTRVFWSARGPSGNGTIYLRLNADQAQSKVVAGKCTQAIRACTIPVSETVTPEPVAYFEMGDREGRKALFQVKQGPLAGNLYRFDADAEPPTSELIGEGMMEGILGASEDLARVYYASKAASAAQQVEGAIEGQPNVYLYDEGTTRFVATLSDGAVASDTTNEFGTPMSTIPINHTARVTPDGQSLVFMSNSPALSKRAADYDNTDAASGEPDAQVYLYEAGADGGAGALHCVSCNPSGARSTGRELSGEGNAGANFWGAATLPLPPTQLYQPRYLTDDGNRVFFNSFDALVLGDTNGKQDVYQWEAAGSGSCGAGSPSYVPASEGCLALLSSGQSPFDSGFLDASASGNDAFFTTAEGLLVQDYGLIDVYDARVGGGFPPPPGPVPSCEGEACQGPLSPPNDPTPASAAFDGAGNVREEPRGRCAKGKTRRKGRCVAKQHRKRAAKAKQRTNHERRAGR